MSRKFGNVFYLHFLYLSYLCKTGTERVYFNGSFNSIFVENNVLLIKWKNICDYT